MSYGTIKVDTITFTDNSVDKSVSLSGLIQNPTFTGNITVTGTISGDVIRGGTTVSGATVTGTTANFVSGVFTTQISGATVTGTTASFTSGVFTNISGTTTTITSGIIASGTAAAPSLAILADLDTGLFSPGANELAVATNGTGRLFINSSGQVGVGATESSSTFGVHGTNAGGYVVSRINNTSATGFARLLFDINGGTNGTADISYVPGTFFAVGPSSNDTTTPIVFRNNNASERLRITSAGLVGIGTSTPQRAVTVQTNSNGASLLLFRSSETNNDYGGVEFGNHPGDITSYRKGAIYYVSDGTGFGRGSIYICNDNAGDSNNVQPSDAKVVITTAGNVGIGATTVQSLLHLSASALADLRFTDTGETTDQKNWVFQTGTGIGAGTFRLRAINDANSSGENAYVITKSGTSIQTHQWLTGGTERARITSAGLVGIGTSSPIGTLDVATAGDSSIVLANETTYTDGIKRARITKKSDNSLVIQACDSASSVDTIFRRAISTESARIDSSGRLLVGTSTSTNNIRLDEKLAVVSVGGISGASFTTYESGTADQPSIIDLQRSRGSSDGLLTVVQSGDTIGSIIFRGSDGSAFQNAARIDAYVDGTPGANDMPGRLVLSTTADGASSPTERLRITSAGLVGIGTSGPSSQLDVRGSATDFDGLRVLNTNSGSGTQTSAAIRLGITNSFGAVNGIRNCRIQATENNTDSNDVHLDFYTNSAVGLDQETVKMRLTAGGALGIGTTSPRRRLEVSGADGLLCINATDTSTGTSQLLFGDNDDDNIGRIYYDHGTDNMAFWTNTSEKARIDTSGRLLVGTSSVISNNFGGTAGLLQVAKNDYVPIGFFAYSNTGGETGYCPYVELNRARGTQATPTTVANGDDLGLVNFYGHDGSTFIRAATIKSVVDGTPGRRRQRPWHRHQERQLLGALHEGSEGAAGSNGAHRNP
jgi:hypothetical protein